MCTSKKYFTIWTTFACQIRPAIWWMCGLTNTREFDLIFPRSSYKPLDVFIYVGICEGWGYWRATGDRQVPEQGSTLLHFHGRNNKFVSPPLILPEDVYVWIFLSGGKPRGGKLGPFPIQDRTSLAAFGKNVKSFSASPLVGYKWDFALSDSNGLISRLSHSPRRRNDFSIRYISMYVVNEIIAIKLQQWEGTRRFMT